MTMIRESSQNIADILQPTLLSIMQIIDCEAVGIHIANEEDSSLELVAQRGISLEARKDLDRIDINANLVNWLAKSELTEGVGDTYEETELFKVFHIENYQNYLGNRIFTDRKSLGVLSCYRISDQPFSPFQRTFINALSDLLGIIVENYRLKVEAEELAAVQERQRLAREIHDAISQSVYSLSLFARSATDAVGENDQEKLFSNLHDIEVTALQAMREMRLLLYQLRESGKDKDIRSSLINRFQQVENRLGIQATKKIDPNIEFPPIIRHEVWRILVESLNNVVKHAEATKVHVEIGCDGEHLTLLIEDNGKGFDVNAFSPGMGLKNIRSRAEDLDGRMEVTSQPGVGTQIIIEVPMVCLEKEERC
jgi:signal transduction histidine kinase